MEKKETGESLSTQKVLASSHDPGWNDPPKWAFTPTQNASATSTKRLLNKRVAFPLVSSPVPNKESMSPISPSSGTMPPPMQSSFNLTKVTNPPLTPPSDKQPDEEKQQTQIGKDQALSVALTNLLAAVDGHIQEKNKAEEIKKRLDAMKLAWLEDKLNSTIHEKMLSLSKALQEKNVEQADQIYNALMMQHGSLCRTWIPGIRHIILEMKSMHENTNLTETETSDPCLLPMEVKDNDE